MTSFAVILVAGSGLALGQSTPTEIHDQVDRVLADDAYAFCHDKGLALFTLEREYCELVGPENDVCPELPKVCKNEIKGDVDWVPTGRTRYGRDGKDYGDRKTANEGSGKGNGKGSGNGSSGSGSNGNGNGNGSGSGSGSSKDKESKSDRDPDASGSPKDDPDKPPPPPKKEDPPEPIEVPGWLAMMMRVLFYLLAAVIVGVIAYLIYKNVMKGRLDDPDPGDKDEPAPEDEEKKEIARGPVETDVDRLLARARAAAARGDFKVAIDDAYAALLRRLEGDGLLDLHPSRTNGDYVRSLRERADLKNAVKGIASDVERVQFGSEAPSPGAFDSIYRRVLPLVGRTAVLLLVLFVTGMNASCDASRAGGDTIAAPAFSTKHVGGTSATGLSAVVELLAANDIDVAFERPEDDQPAGDNHKAILIMPGTKLDTKSWNRLRAWVKSTGGVLIVAGWRKEIGQDFHVDYAPSQGPGPVRPATLGYGSAAQYGNVTAGRAQLALPHVGALASQTSGPVVEGWVDDQSKMQVLLKRNEEPYAMISDNYFETGAGKILVFADDRLFANVAMALGDNAAYLVGLLKGVSVSKLEVWDDVLIGNGGGSGGGGNGGAATPLESLAKAHLLPIILQLFALVLLYIIYRGTRFGTPKDHKEESRRAFADHTRALGMTYARAKASRHAASVFSVWALDRLRERLLGAGRRGLTPLAEAIAARTGRPVGGVMQVLVEASGLRDEVAPPSSFRGGSEAPPAYGPRAEQRSAKTESARHLWIIEQLDMYLAATKGTTKTTGRAAR